MLDPADDHDHEETAAFDRDARPPKQPERAARGLSLVLYHNDGADAHRLRRGTGVVVGRGHGADIVVADPTLSRTHAHIRWDDAGVHVEDLGSRNGTFVNGERITEVYLHPSDHLRLAGVVAAIHEVPGSKADGRLGRYEEFLRRLEHEVARCRTFGSTLAVLRVASVGEQPEHVSRWSPDVLSMLRPVDLVTNDGPHALIVALPEHGGGQARRFAERLHALQGGGDLRIGLALYPEAGDTAHALIGNARALAASATDRGPVQSILPRAGARADELVVAGEAMHSLQRMIRRVAPADITVLIQGETGTGKELVVRALHDGSARREGPLCTVNCAAIPQGLIESTLFGHERGAFTGADRMQKGLFEQADGGTLFLDEVGELPAAAQSALLRVLETRRVVRVGGIEEHPVDVRLVAATHRELGAMVYAGEYRRDLFYRLNAVILDVPPLRERRDEIEALALHFLELANRTHDAAFTGIEPAALELLRSYTWPGNIRELRNVIERAVVVGRGPLVRPRDLDVRVRQDAAIPGASGREPTGQLDVPHTGNQGATASSSSIPPEPEDEPLDGEAGFKERIREYEIHLMTRALRQTDGNKTAAAKLLKMPVRTFMHKCRSYGLGSPSDDGE